MGRLEEAREAVNNSLVLNAGYDEAWLLRGKICEAMAHPEEAEYCYREAIRCHDFAVQVEPDNPEAVAAKVALFMEHERPDDALAAIEASPVAMKDPKLAATRAELLLRVGRAPEAVFAAHEAVQLDPASAHAWRATGRSLAAAGRTGEAVEALQRALDLREDRTARVDLAKALLALGRAQEALVHVNFAVDLGAPVRTLRAQILLTDRRPDEAIAACEDALRAGEPPDLAWFTLSRARARAGDVKGALRTLDAAIGADPRREEYWCEKGRILLEAGAAPKALKALDAALALNPDYRQAWLYKGRVMEALGRSEEARACLDRARPTGVGGADK
jgi:superkiller protein 3